ncbi:MAG: Rid family hydrolase [Woeseiaceae bacterium]|nr:Rid family hydrolase [Woeseiaceae bacterium]
MYRILATAAVLLLPVAALADDHDGAERVIESGGRTVTFTNEVRNEHTGYNSPWHFSHAIRAGDFVYVSGVIIGARHDEPLPISKERFREETEIVFEILERYLKTADAGLKDVVKINTFHVLDGKTTDLTIEQQALVIAETRDKYGVEPHPAWTAVGTTGLFSPRGIVEIELVVYAPN